MSLGRAGSRSWRIGIYTFLFFNTCLVQSSVSFIKVTKNGNDIIEKKPDYNLECYHHGEHGVKKLTLPEHN